MDARNSGRTSNQTSDDNPELGLNLNLDRKSHEEPRHSDSRPSSGLPSDSEVVLRASLGDQLGGDGDPQGQDGVPQRLDGTLQEFLQESARQDGPQENRHDDVQQQDVKKEGPVFASENPTQESPASA